MLSFGMLVVFAGLYYFEYYQVLFWLIALSAANGALGAIYAYLNPAWYNAKRVEEVGGDHDYFGIMPVPKSLYVTKVALVIAAGVADFHVGLLAGYF